MLVADFEVARREFTVGLAMQVGPGELVAVLGPSGAGKTTFLEAVAGLVSLTKGAIHLDDQCLSSASGPGSDVPVGLRGVGLLRQDPGLFPHLTVLQNICYPPRVEESAARAAAARMGLEALLDARPRGLSGGEAQRVALCRALQPEVRLLCLDEPFSSLDRPLGRELLELVRAELQARGSAALLVTHQLQEAQAFASRMAVLYRGSLLQVGDPGELVLHPASALVASLVGYRGWLRRGEHLIALHPDRIQLSQPAGEPGAISGRVVGMRPDGARVDVEVEAEGEWTGRFHCRFDEAPELGSTLLLRADDAPQFSGAEARLD